jgi:hypothetical protein
MFKNTDHVSCRFALAFLVFFTLGANSSRSASSAVDIIVRILDAKTEKPFARFFVSVFTWNPPADLRPGEYSFGQEIGRGTTDDEGRAVLRVSAQPGDQIGLDIRAPAGELYGCWQRRRLSLNEILDTGLVAEYNASKCGKLRWQPSTKPGEIVLIDRKLTWWDHFLRETP